MCECQGEGIKDGRSSLACSLRLHTHWRWLSADRRVETQSAAALSGGPTPHCLRMTERGGSRQAPGRKQGRKRTGKQWNACRLAGAPASTSSGSAVRSATGYTLLAPWALYTVSMVQSLQLALAKYDSTPAAHKQ